MVESLTIIHVDVAGGSRLCAWEHLESDRVANGVQQTHLVSVLKDRNDGALTNKDSLLVIRQRHLLQASARNDDPIVPVVPSRGLRQGAVDAPDLLVRVWVGCWLCELRANENVLAEHELSV